MTDSASLPQDTQSATRPALPVRLKAGCKINLYLRITGVRENGYHELDTLFYPLSEPSDTLDIEEGAAGSGLTLVCERADLCTERNTLHKAWRVFAETTGFRPDLRLTLTKGVPDGAGLGGGSADAAAFLNFLNASAGKVALNDEELNEVAARIGADVPFFLKNVPARATGIGEILVPCEVDLSGFTLLLACPPEHVSTPWAFKAWDDRYANKMDIDATERLTLSAHMFTRPSSRALWLFNSFESVVFAAFPKLRAYKGSLIRHGAAAVVMSGSGASLFALYREMEKAMQASESLMREGVKTFIHHL
ncbi:4-(cytidine 5'-diphospho)-2-C-methyl-D-erythritol kinase [Desulfovibrio mangrovi]|uniref:4-(cytidine 5'-diphospho)-2-C-methyl-D-erythritol kinase n=1 Tax=Desulfovibrio mangrovi TaxID=2976983 RepID=UPI002245B802|nr:4-(cytidine 5'-diphospho)-2-C-methyl-D-erythritol kinase [Desulfovibrio mangrovi]UZP68487.1 4-(cytidine 5'-diphospho)-2-C-methyl-D-erythritol kinase [Desulfovibrio mangrovi]